MNVLHCMLVPCITMHQYLFLSMLNTLQYIIVFSFPLCIYRTHNVLRLVHVFVRFDTCICWEWNSVQYIYSVRKKPETCSRYRFTLTCGHTCIMPNEQTYMKNSFTMETWYIYIYICKIRSLKYNVLHLYHCVCIFQEFKSLLLLFYFLFEWSTFQ